MIFSDYETVAKAFPGRTNGSPLRKKYSFIFSGYETVAKFLGGEGERPFPKLPGPSRDFRRGLKFEL